MLQATDSPYEQHIDDICAPHHSTKVGAIHGFLIPLMIHQESTTTMKKNSPAADLLRRTALIIWDEVPMQHKFCFEAVDQTLRDIRSDPDALFGGQPAVLGGDFAQILPVVKNGNRASIVLACLQKSSVWPQLQQLILHQNMRLQNDGVDGEYAHWLSKMSYDPALNGSVSLPNYVQKVSEVVELYDSVFPNINITIAHRNPEFFRQRFILTPFNGVKLDMNEELLPRMEGNFHDSFGANSAQNEDPTLQQFSAESLQQINLPSLLLSRLRLKISAPVMLMRNLDQTYGLNNGSRLIISQIGVWILAGNLQGGDFDGELRIIPRIPMTSLEGDLAFILCRHQFPVQLGFAMTINKSQGQSLRYVGFNLRQPAFTHGQLYVALSRATKVVNLTILLPEGAERKTVNVVYHEMLQYKQQTTSDMGTSGHVHI